MKKLYYSIGEISDIAGVKPHVLRYWEKTFQRLNPSKNNGGQRIYTDEDLKTILWIKELMHERKYSTEGAQQILNTDPDEAEDERLTLRKDLEEARYLLSELLKDL